MYIRSQRLKLLYRMGIRLKLLFLSNEGDSHKARQGTPSLIQIMTA